MIHYTLRQLQFFLAVADFGGLAQAARRLGVSNAAVAAAITKLERAIGIKLFDRYPAHGLRLTKTGAEFLDHARVLLRQSEELSQKARGLAAQSRGHINFGCFYALAYMFAPTIIYRHKQMWPLVSLEIVEGRFSELLERLEEDTDDLVLSYDQGFDVDRFHVRPVTEVRPCAILSRSHPLASKKSIPICALDGIPYIKVQEPGPGLGYLEALNQHGLHPEIAFVSRSYELVRSCVGKGMGFTLAAFQPRNEITYHDDPVVALPLDEDIGSWPIVLACKKSRQNDPIVRNFSNLCITTIDDETGNRD